MRRAQERGDGRFLKRVFYAFYLILLIIAVDYAFYRLYISKLFPRELPRLDYSYDPKTGVVHDDKKSCPGKFSLSKPKGVIRVGCFGDSFTHGDEVGEDYDYPSLLQKLLRDNGYGNAEVINFGQGGSGFHQAFNVWKFFASGYGLDYVVIGPSCFQLERDSTFSVDLDYPVFQSAALMHDRYILQRHKAKLVSVSGKETFIRIRDYFRFFPLWRYLRYDLRPPVFLNAPIDFFFPGNTLRTNPFYYSRDVPGERLEIYSLLLKEISDSSPQVILFNYDDEVVSLAKGLNRDNIFAFSVQQQDTFPYVCRGNHNSPTGNLLLAEQLFDCLRGSPRADRFVLQPAAFTGWRELSAPKGDGRLLSEYEDVRIEYSGRSLGRFYEIGVPCPQCCSSPGCEVKVNTLDGVGTLMCFSDDEHSPLDWHFLAYAPGMNRSPGASFRLVGGRGEDVVLQGSAGFIPGFNIGFFDFGPVYLESGKFRGAYKLYQEHKGFFMRNKKFNVYVDRIPVLSGLVNGEGLEFSLVDGRIFGIRADGGRIFDLAGSTLFEGDVHIVFRSNFGKNVARIRWARWKCQKQDLFFGGVITKPLRLLSAGRQRSVPDPG